MKIGYFVTNFPYPNKQKNYSYGGSSLAAYYLAKEMVKKGHEIHIFTTSVDKKDYIEYYDNLVIHRFGTNIKFLTSNISIGMFYKPLKIDLDIVHTHFDIIPGPFACLTYIKDKKVPLVITYHGDWNSDFGSIFRKLIVSLNNIIFVNKLLSCSNVIISPSKTYIQKSPYLKKYLNKISVIPNGVNGNDYNIKDSINECRLKIGLPINKKIILFLGSLSVYKGPEVLLNSMPQVIKNNINVKLVFAGDGAERTNLIELCEHLNIQNSVQFVGYVDDVLKPLYYKASDVFVLPSTMSTECFPLAILEAMATGKPIVASDIGGIPDALEDGYNGILVHPKNIEQLSSSILNILNNDQLRDDMGKNGLNLSKKYDWKIIADETEKIYNNLL